MKLLILDWNNLLYRSYFSSKSINMTNNNGEDSGSFYFSLNIFQKLKEHVNFNKDTDKIIFTFDVKKSKESRLSIFPEYKWTRKKMEDLSFFKQMEMFKKMLIWTKHDVLFEDYLEADDICWILVNCFKDNKKIEHINVYSNDKDYYQFLSEKVTIIRPWKKWTFIDYGLNDYNIEYSNLTNKQFIELKAIAWDASDNIIGLPKIGEKTWIKILKEFWSIENWINSDNWIKKLSKTIREEIKEQNNGFDSEIKWYKSNWKTVNKSLKDILSINFNLAKLNLTYDFVPEENKMQLHKQLKSLFAKQEKDLDHIQWYLDYYNIKKIASDNI